MSSDEFDLGQLVSSWGGFLFWDELYLGRVVFGAYCLWGVLSLGRVVLWTSS